MSDRKYYREVDTPPEVVEIIDQNGNRQNAVIVVMEDDIESRVNAGRQLTACFNESSVTNNGEVYLLLETNSKEMHTVLDVKCVGQWRFQSFAGATITDKGTPVTPFNRKTACPFTIESNLYQNAVVSNDGSERLSFYFGAGTNPSRVTSTEQTDDLESIICPDSQVLIKLTNLSGSASYLSVIADFHEQDVIE